jgi:thiol:disulfide interchange protein DsbC
MPVFVVHLPKEAFMLNSVSRSASVLLASLVLSLAACSPPEGASEKAKKDTSNASSQTESKDASSQEPSIERSVAELFNGAKPKSVTESVIPGLYEVAVNGGVFYTDKTGKYFLNGEMVEVEGRKSITGATRDKLRAEMMPQLDVKDAIVFKAKGKTKEVLNVFTDVECGYCREFHKHIETYTKQGYEIHYYPWPRSGTQGPVYDEMVSVWCASDKQKALTQAKTGSKVSAKSCDNPVAKYFALGHELGVNGTPAVFLNDGKQIGGYVPPENIDAAIAGARGVSVTPPSN